MRRLTLALATVGLVLSLTTAEVRADRDQEFDQLCLDVLESLQAYYPVRSTEMGIHAYDHRFTDYSSKAVSQMIRTLTSFEQKLYKYRQAKLNDDRRLNYHLIKSNVDIALHDLKRIGRHKNNPHLYVDEAVRGLSALLRSEYAPLSERVVAVMARMRAVPELFETARQNLKNPPPVFVALAVEELEAGIQFYREAAGDLMARFPERADEILKVSTAAREAMNEFLIWLNGIPTGPEDGFAIGKDAFDYKLKHEYFLDIDSDSLLAIGEALLSEARQTHHDYEVYVDSHHQNGSDSIFVPASFTRQDLLDYYSWEVEQVKTFLRLNDFVTIPENIAPVVVIETPPYLRTLVSGIAYEPAPPFDSVQTGYFYIRPIPEDLEGRQLEARFRYVHRRGFKGSVVHEAYPGHHLQLQVAERHDDPVRVWQQNPMMVEGWALYCEEMMYRAGLYGEEDPARWLAILRGIHFRAARIVADVKLHTGRMTVDECVDWLMQEFNRSTQSDRTIMEKEVRRYTLTPTYQMAYLMGKRQIQRLRAKMEEREGDAFSERAFHDRLLAEGAVAPALLWSVLGLK